MLTSVEAPSFLTTRRGKLTLLLLCAIALLKLVKMFFKNCDFSALFCENVSRRIRHGTLLR